MGFGVSNLTLSRGGVTILDGVTFTLAKGDALYLRGPNGSGKSTLLRALAGLGRIDAGDVNLPEAKVYAGHLDAIKGQLSVTENLAFWASLYDTTLTDEILAKAALTELRNRPAGTLSAGQKRRLGLARLLVANADLWLMDEPTTALDTENADRIAALIKAHLDAGGMAIIATHLDLNVQGKVLSTTDFAPNAAAADPFLEDFL